MEDNSIIQVIGTVKHHYNDSGLGYMPTVGQNKIQQDLDKAHSCISALTGPWLL